MEQNTVGMMDISEENPERKHSQFRDIWRRLCKNRLAVLGMIILCVLVLCAIFADVIAPYHYAAQDYSAMHAAPSWEHLMGCDNTGRDIFSRVVYGARTSLVVGFISLAVGGIIGCALGAVAGYFGGGLETAIMGFCDILMAIPSTVLAIAIASTLGTGLVNAMIALGISSIPNFARIVRSSSLSVKNQEYVEAARAIGAKDSHIIWQHVFPNILAPIIVQATLGVGKAIIMCASLSFLGLGIEPPQAEWGNMLSAARKFVRDYPHEVIFPGLAIMLTVLAINLFGDGLRDALDPKLKR